MHLALNDGWVLATYFMSLRVGALLLMSPIFPALAGLIQVRVIFVVCLSACLVSGLGIQVGGQVDMALLVVGSVSEILIGALMSFGVFSAFGAFSVAGKLLDVQTGFGMGTVFDPLTRTGSPMFATMLNMTGYLMFFALDAHHALIRGISFSVERSPLGRGLPELALDAVIAQFGVMFSLGMALCAPVLFALVFVEAAMAIMSRVLPQMNVFVVGVQVKILVGIVVLAASLKSTSPVMSKIFSSIFVFWGRVLPS